MPALEPVAAAKNESSCHFLYVRNFFFKLFDWAQEQKKTWNALFLFPCMGDLDLAPSALVTQVQKVPVALTFCLLYTPLNLSCMVEWLCSFAG
jgi:hypothetical protein